MTLESADIKDGKNPVAVVTLLHNEPCASGGLKEGRWDETFALRRGPDAEFVEIAV